MKPKNLTRMMAASGLAGVAAVHWLPKRFLPFESRTCSAVLLVGLLLAVHRNPLRLLYKDAVAALQAGKQGIDQATGVSGSTVSAAEKA